MGAGKYSDGAGLWLVKSGADSGKWVFNYTVVARKQPFMFLLKRSKLSECFSGDDENYSQLAKTGYLAPSPAPAGRWAVGWTKRKYTFLTFALSLFIISEIVLRRSRFC